MGIEWKGRLGWRESGGRINTTTFRIMSDLVSHYYYEIHIPTSFRWRLGVILFSIKCPVFTWFIIDRVIFRIVLPLIVFSLDFPKFPNIEQFLFPLEPIFIPNFVNQRSIVDCTPPRFCNRVISASMRFLLFILVSSCEISAMYSLLIFADLASARVSFKSVIMRLKKRWNIEWSIHGRGTQSKLKLLLGSIVSPTRSCKMKRRERCPKAVWNFSVFLVRELRI